MEVIEIQTLIDITNTRVIRPSQGNQLQLDQQRNFITLMQCIELRSIVTYDDIPRASNDDIKSLGFGTNYKGKHRVWTFRIRPDRGGMFSDDLSNPIGLLESDLHQVPIIKNLHETINIDIPIFDCKDQKYKNTIIKILPNTLT